MCPAHRRRVAFPWFCGGGSCALEDICQRPKSHSPLLMLPMRSMLPNFLGAPTPAWVAPRQYGAARRRGQDALEPVQTFGSHRSFAGAKLRLKRVGFPGSGASRPRSGHRTKPVERKITPFGLPFLPIMARFIATEYPLSRISMAENVQFSDGPPCVGLLTLEVSRDIRSCAG